MRIIFLFISNKIQKKEHYNIALSNILQWKETILNLSKNCT